MVASPHRRYLDGQLALTRPMRRVRAVGMHESQRQAVALLERQPISQTLSPSDLAAFYSDPAAAMRRLASRGYLRRVGRGRYQRVRLGEVKR